MTPIACSSVTRRSTVTCPWVILHQHEAAQLRPKMAADAAGQRRHDRLAIGCQPTLAAIAHHPRGEPQVLHLVRLVAFELRTPRNRHPKHLRFRCNPLARVGGSLKSPIPGVLPRLRLMLESSAIHDDVPGQTLTVEGPEVVLQVVSEPSHALDCLRLVTNGGGPALAGRRRKVGRVAADAHRGVRGAPGLSRLNLEHTLHAGFAVTWNRAEIGDRADDGARKTRALLAPRPTTRCELARTSGSAISCSAPAPLMSVICTV